MARHPYIVDGVLVYVTISTRISRMPRRPGAETLSPIETKPLQRPYRYEDPEGHRWMFATRQPG